MNPTQSTPHGKRSPAARVCKLLLWVWLTGLTISVCMGLRLINDLDHQLQQDITIHQLQVMGTRLSELGTAVQTLQSRPEPATSAAMQGMRENVARQIEQLNQAVATRVSAKDLLTLRAELEQLKARPAAPVAVSPPKPRSTRSVTQPTKAVFPFRVMRSELRAGQRSVSLAPASGDFLSADIQIVFPGETVAQWHLESIDENEAVFRAGKQTYRATIPQGRVMP